MVSDYKTFSQKGCKIAAQKKISFSANFALLAGFFGATIRIGREMLCLPYTGFFSYNYVIPLRFSLISGYLFHLFCHSFKIAFMVQVLPQSINCYCYPILDTRHPVLCPLWWSRYPPTWILKRGGLESSGQRLIFLYGKTKGGVKQTHYFYPHFVDKGFTPVLTLMRPCKIWAPYGGHCVEKSLALKSKYEVTSKPG